MTVNTSKSLLRGYNYVHSFILRCYLSCLHAYDKKMHTHAKDRRYQSYNFIAHVRSNQFTVFHVNLNAHEFINLFN